MRHVQIVSLPDSDEGRGTVASASHVFTRKASGALERTGSAVTLHDARSGERLETMMIGGELLPPQTFTMAVTWRFLDAGADRYVATALGGDCVLHHFQSGKIRGRVAGAFVRQFSRTILGTAVDGIATLERPWGEDALGAGVRLLDRSGEALRSMDLPETVPFGDKPWELDFRSAAWKREERWLVAFSQPKFDHAVGRLTVLDLSSAGDESVLYDGVPWERLLDDSVGASVSIGPMGRRAMVGVAPPGLPEDLQRPGYACLLEVPPSRNAPLGLVKRYTSVWK